MGEESQVDHSIKGSRASFLRTTQGLLLIARLALAAVFVYAGISKVGDPGRFAVDISNYKVLSGPVVTYIAHYLPYLEIAIGFALISKLFYPGALALSGGLMIMFFLLTVTALARGLDISCGCFGNMTSSLLEATVRNVMLLSMWFTILWLEHQSTTQRRRSNHPSAIPQAS